MILLKCSLLRLHFSKFSGSVFILKKKFISSLKANILISIIYVLSHRPTLTAIDVSSFSLLSYFDDFEIHSIPFSNIRMATMLVFTKRIV
jgi:hypothetical protein